jgi:hypothetical protein
MANPSHAPSATTDSSNPRRVGTTLLDCSELLEVDVVNGEFVEVTALPGIDRVVDVVTDGDRIFVLAESAEGGSSVYEVALG